MLPFRDKDKIPKHDLKRKECKHYSSYLDTLERDFHKRCGYCNDINSYKVRSFAIDHFIPQNPKDFVHDIKPNHYFNLVYSCNYCNSAKSNKWPTKDASIPNDGKVGFVKPTDIEYDNLFFRDKDGSILPRNGSALPIYIIEELDLKNPIHSLMWRFERILNLENEVKEKLKSVNDTELKDLHYELMNEVIEITRCIFSNND